MTTLQPQALERILQRLSKVKTAPFLPLLVRRSDLDRKSEPQQTGNLDALLGPEEAVPILIWTTPRNARGSSIEMRPFRCLKFE